MTKYVDEYQRLLQASNQMKIPGSKYRPFKWIINIDSKGVNSDWKKKHLQRHNDQ